MVKKELNKEQIKIALFLKKVPGTGNNIPSIGYYLFKEVKNIELNENGYLKRYIISAYYHPDKPDFSAGCLINAQVASFFKSHSVGPKENGYDITNKVIHVKEISLQDSVYEGQPYKSYKTVWEIIDSQNADEVEAVLALDESAEADDVIYIDEELEILAWEEQSGYYMGQGEIEYLLDELDRLNKENPEDESPE